MGEGAEELEKIGEDFSIVATEKEKERLERKTLVKRMVVETHLRICHYKNYPVSLKMTLSCPHYKNLSPLLLLVCKLKRG